MVQPLVGSRIVKALMLPWLRLAKAHVAEMDRSDILSGSPSRSALSVICYKHVEPQTVPAEYGMLSNRHGYITVSLDTS